MFLGNKEMRNPTHRPKYVPDMLNVVNVLHVYLTFLLSENTYTKLRAQNTGFHWIKLNQNYLQSICSSAPLEPCAQVDAGLREHLIHERVSMNDPGGSLNMNMPSYQYGNPPHS